MGQSCVNTLTMLKEKNYLFQRLNQLIDLLLITVAFFVAVGLRNWILVPNFFPTYPIISLEGHHWLLWIMAPVMILTQMVLGIYNSQRMQRTSDLLMPIFIATIVTTAVGFGVVIGLGRTVVPGLAIISKPQIIFFALLILIFLSIKGIIMKRFFLRSVPAV